MVVTPASALAVTYVMQKRFITDARPRARKLSRIALSRSLPAGYVFRAQADPDAGRGRIIELHQAAAGNIRAYHQPLEAALSGGGAGLDTAHT